MYNSSGNGFITPTKKFIFSWDCCYLNLFHLFFQGFLCTNCNAKYHFECLNRYCNTTMKDFRCIGCNEVLQSATASIGTVEEDTSIESPTSGFKRSKRK